MLAALALTAIAAAGWLLGNARRAAAPPAHLAISIPASQRVTAWAEPASAMSSDGRLLLYNADADGVTRIYARRLTDAVGTPLSGSEGGIGPVLSPDNLWVAFNGANGRWQKIPVQGGAPVTINYPPDVTVGVLRWNGMDGHAVTLGDGTLALLRNTGAIDSVAVPDRTRHEQSLDVMEVLPGGNLLVIATDDWPAGHLFSVEPATGKRTPLLTASVSWAATAGDHLLWADPVGVLFVADWNGKGITGPPHAFGASAQTTRGGRPKVAVARDGNALAYVPTQPASLARVSRDGRVQTLLAEPRTYHDPRVSPDGRQVSLDIAGTERDVWLLDLADTTLNRVSFETSAHDAMWTPDGRRLIMAVARNNLVGIYGRAADGGGVTDSIFAQGPQISVHAVTPDGRTGIAVNVTSVAQNGFDLMTVPLVGDDRRARPLLNTRYMEGFPALSRDGRWLAYVGDESGRPEVYVRAFPGMSGKVVVSQNGGMEPVWSRDGHELFYVGTVGGIPQLMSAKVETTPQFRVTSRTALFPYTEYETATPHANYDVMPDGQSFIMVRLGRASEFTYLQDWPALLQQQAATNR